MSKFISRARQYFRKKKTNRAAENDGANSETTNLLKKRIGTLSKKMIKLKIQLHDVSLAYLEIIQSRLREKMGRTRQRRQPVVERRKLGTLALRMKSTASGVFNRTKIGKVLSFPAIRDGSPIKDSNN